MPGDILGSHILQQTASGARDLVFQPGPVFCNVLLADEINRASPKTQSAMLETMQERTVTLLGTTRALPAPFFVLASQNPIELEGTYPLPEAQLDRFLFRLNVGDLPSETLLDILTGRRHGTVPEASWTLPQETLEQCFATVDRVALPEAVARWIARLVTATHPGAAEATPRVRTYVRYGASPRAAIALAEAARAAALLAGRPSVGFEDVKMLVEPVLNHRLILNYQARLDQVTASALSQELAAALDPAGMRLPQGVEVKA
jgi:MoxR-like ATPase